MSKILEAINILKELGLPKAQQNDRSALTLLAVLDVKKQTPWSESKKRPIKIHDILIFIEKHYRKKYAENTRETIRRQTLHQFEQAGVVIINPDDPKRPTNSPKTVYEISDEVLKIIKKYNTPKWSSLLKTFTNTKGKLIDRYEKRKKDNQLSIILTGKNNILFSPGKHNELQIKIINELRPRFFKKAKVVYVGDAARKILFSNKRLLKKLKIPITQHDKLADVVLYDSSNNLLFLVEAVTAHGPVSPKRQIELEKTLKNCKVKRIYISAFPDFHEFKKHIDNIAWDTEVWLESNPDHMIHFNGPKFFTLYPD